MRIDLVSIFPEYFAPLELSLPGKARQAGVFDLHVHDLRRWTHDRHRTVDDTPYGGGAGMVMKPEPWGEALDELLSETSTGEAVLVVPTPSGRPFTQRTARLLATKQHLVFACGRYEGIDQRVVQHASTRVEVVELSLGDYVLNGGEIAAMAMVESVVRLLPGFMGNPDSLVEESHEDGLLEHPVYTKPPTFRGLEVPAVLRGGDHRAIERWRHEQSVRRTVARRPDLARPAEAVAGLAELRLTRATRGDAGELLTLQRACWVQEQLANPGLEIDALREDLATVEDWLRSWDTWVGRDAAGRMVLAVRARVADEGATWDIGRLMVAPDLQGRGLGRALLEFAEALAPDTVTGYVLFTGAGSTRNQKLYRKAGYRPAGSPAPGVVRLRRKR